MPSPAERGSNTLISCTFMLPIGSEPRSGGGVLQPNELVETINICNFRPPPHSLVTELRPVGKRIAFRLPIDLQRAMHPAGVVSGRAHLSAFGSRSEKAAVGHRKLGDRRFTCLRRKSRANSHRQLTRQVGTGARVSGKRLLFRHLRLARMERIRQIKRTRQCCRGRIKRLRLQRRGRSAQQAGNLSLRSNRQ